VRTSTVVVRAGGRTTAVDAGERRAGEPASSPTPLRILVPSIVDPRGHPGGAGAWTRGFLSLLERTGLAADVECLVPRSGLERFHRLRQAASALRSLASPLPSKALFLHTRSFRRTLQRRLRSGRVDLVIINGGDLLWVLDELPAGLPVVLVAHNVEHALFASQCRSLGWRRAPMGALLRHDWRKLRGYEVTGTRRAHDVIFLSADDAVLMSGLTGGLNAICVPPVFAYAPHDRGPRQLCGQLLHVGVVANFTWWPNRVGLEWLERQVLPGVRRPLTVHLFGAGSREAARGRPRFVGHGFVPALRTAWEGCDFMLCPTVAGAGVKVKLAEILYNRVPVLATPASVRGLPIDAGEGLVQIEGARAWAAFLDSPQADALAAASVSRAMAARFSAEAYLDAVRAFLGGVLLPAGARAREDG
jgi:Glycosyl transferases group 1